MQDQIREGIAERVTESEKRADNQKSENVFYLPYRHIGLSSVSLPNQLS